MPAPQPHPQRRPTRSEPAEVTDYGYRVVSQRRFDRENFTQGLEFHDGRLYVSSGGYGKSMIRVYDFPEMTPLLSVPIDPRIFAEGLTIIDNQLILLSWRERVMLVYSLPDLTLLGKALYRARAGAPPIRDRCCGSATAPTGLYSANLADGGQTHRVTGASEGKPLRNLNELEWVDGEIWANVWQTDEIARIDPDTG
jgi:glutamine cyclotransferase